MWSPLRDFYQTRRERARLDWHAIWARDLMRVGDYGAALAEVKKMWATAADDTMPTKAQIADEISARLKASDSLVERFAQHKGRPPTLEDVLMVARATVLAPARSVFGRPARRRGRSSSAP